MLIDAGTYGAICLNIDDDELEIYRSNPAFVAMEKKKRIVIWNRNELWYMPNDEEVKNLL